MVQGKEGLDLPLQPPPEMSNRSFQKWEELAHEKAPKMRIQQHSTCRKRLDFRDFIGEFTENQLM